MRLARGAVPAGQKTMEGRIEIAPIENPRHRRITYAKRKAGLVRKATELAVLCDADVAVLMCNADQRPSVYSSISVDDVLAPFPACGELGHKPVWEMLKLPGGFL